jgi:hypothetical protein
LDDERAAELIEEVKKIDANAEEVSGSVGKMRGQLG